MKKILIIIGALRVGGAEKITIDLVRFMNLKNKKVVFLVFDEEEGKYEKKAIELGCKVVHLRKPQVPFLAYFSDLKKLNEEEGPFDVVHSCTLLNNGINLFFFRLLGCRKLISHSHSTNSGRKDNVLTKVYERLMKILIRLFTTDFLACGIQAGQYLYGENVFSEKGVIINNGVDFGSFSYDTLKRNRIRKEFNLEGKYVVANVARLTKLKNHEFLIDVFKEFMKLKPNSILVLVGDGEERNKLEKKIKELNLEKDVLLLGERYDIPDLLNAFDLFVLPSQYEGLPLSLVEAQINGLPVVASANITKEIKLCDKFEFVSLEENPKKWAEIFLRFTEYEREGAHLYDGTDKYDIRKSSLELERIYMRL